MEAAEFLRVSVPFRGSCSEITKRMAEYYIVSPVSVPFRGSCSEILVLQALILRGFKMPFAARIVFLSLSCCDLLKKCASSLVIADAARISLTV